MNKNILKCFFCLFAIAAVASNYSAYGQNRNGSTRSIIINNGDTTINGKKFSELDKDERAKLREEFKEMEKNFRGGTSVRSRGNDVVIKRGGGIEKDIVITKDGRDPNVLYWNDDIGAQVRSFNFKGNRPGELRVFRHDGDSIFTGKDFHVFRFDGDSSMSFNFNTDSMFKRFKYNMDGLDSNLRKRVITMHREMIPSRPGVRAFKGEGPGIEFERRLIPSIADRNNSSSFNYNYIDKDGISSRMNIRISNANGDQLKKITGSETINKSLEVNDLTLFPNFSSGKMTLSFNLTGKGTAKVNVFDSDMKAIFTDEAPNFSGNYVKQLSIPKNGVYYVAISQNGTWFVKRMIKE